ncbi:translation initiation factor eIF3 subunit [Tuber magnatum]|uniref:Eukaryotic translation initiation factor 3 subunit J n=1 Tax=Tuber magnatum TaxID=42249 RepID=A0A317SFU6_9PEZI|nr:translation initiation factor eIF3 subunit [Tuber magnatum]
MAPPKEWNDEEESSSEEEEVGRIAPRAATKKKWDDDEESEEEVLESWDAAEDSEEERKKAVAKQDAVERAAAEAAANKKSKTQRIAERQAQNAAQREATAAAARESGDMEDETPAERRAREERMRIEGDLAHATDLFGTVGVGAGSGGTKDKPITTGDPEDPTRSIDLSSLPLFAPKGKDEFTRLREVLVPLLVANTKKAHYSLFLQEFVRQLGRDMSSEQVRKVASGLTTLANEKQREEKATDKGGKKTKAAKGKATLAATGKESDKFDTTDYLEPTGYDDFDDFM